MHLKQLLKPIIPPQVRREIRAAEHCFLSRGPMRADAQKVGWHAAYALRRDSFLDEKPAKATLRVLRLPGYRFPLYYRPGTSDAAVIRQVFIEQEYGCVGDLDDVQTIVDCGANIGCTSFYLLSRYPTARLIAIEPDQGNLDVCRRNLEPFLDRVTFVQAGVWPEPGPLKLVKGTHGDGREWSFQVRPCMENESADFMGYTIGNAISHLETECIDLLKIDIEAAESYLFSQNCGKWLPKVRCIVIELHGAECETKFRSALSQGDWTFARNSELTYCHNLAHMTATDPPHR